MPKGLEKTVSLTQDKFVFAPVLNIGTTADFVDFMTFGSDAALYPAGTVVSLTSDIDLKNVVLPSLATFAATLADCWQRQLTRPIDLSAKEQSFPPKERTRRKTIISMQPEK